MLFMRWVDLAFLHWPVTVESLRGLVPSQLELDTFDGSAWVGVIPFEMRDVRADFLPPIPTARNFPELNVRTYVRHGERAGVYFFSLDAGSWLAVVGARLGVNLPYYHARMEVERRGDSIAYHSVRAHPGSAAAEFDAEYRPTSDVFLADEASFEYWCTERLSLFTTAPSRRLLRLDIEHERWPLQRATVQIQGNTMAAAARIDLPASEPHVLFARQLDVKARWPTIVQDRTTS